MRFLRPQSLLAGFHADAPDPAVAELVHAGEQWAGSEYMIGDHAHRTWELYLQLHGTSRWHSWEDPRRSRRYVIEPGGLFAAAPHVRHGQYGRVEAKHHFVFAAIDLEAVFARHRRLRALWPRDRCIHLASATTLEAPFRQLVRELAVSRPMRSEGLRMAVDSLIVETSRLLHAAAQPRPRLRRRAGKAVQVPLLVPSHPGVRTVRDLLDAQFQQPWRLADLSRLAGLSPSHLAQLFRTEVGMPPHQYMIRRRIDRAKELLTYTDAPITQIGLELGFSSSQHFSKRFRASTGRTAQQYRASSGP
jgi:AraC-like DNA-binding protein